MSDLNPAKESWDAFVKKQGGSLLQSWQWGQFQSNTGKKIEYIAGPDWQALVIIHSLPFGKKYAYVPYGPIWDKNANHQKVFYEFIKKIQNIAKTNNLIFLKIEPQTNNDDAKTILKTSGFKKSDKSIQPQDTIIVNLEKPEQEILQGFKEIAQRRIKEAQKKNVRIRADNSPEAIEKFIDLIKKTAERDQFRAHQASYYKILIETLSYSGQAELLLADTEGETNAGIIVGYFGDAGYYLHGGSIGEFRPMHALLFEAMKKAKQKGCGQFDLYGVAPENAKPTHPWSGITKFKETFNAQRRHYIGAFDYPISKIWYKTYLLAKKIK